MLKKYALIILAFLTVLLLLVACGANTIKGSGVLKTETRAVSRFTGVEASGISTVTLVAGSEAGVTVEADENLLSVLEARVENGVLHLGAKAGTIIMSGTVHYTVVYTTLDNIVLSGSATAEALDLNQDQLSVVLSGSATLTTSGQVNTLNLTESGSSTFNAFLLTAQQVNATMSASTDAQLTVEGTLNATLSGSASLVYRGSATNVQQTVSGSASIQRAQQ